MTAPEGYLVCHASTLFWTIMAGKTWKSKADSMFIPDRYPGVLEAS